MGFLSLSPKAETTQAKERSDRIPMLNQDIKILISI